MPFAAALSRSLQDRSRDAPAEFIRGDSLEEVLNRHLRTVERAGGGDVFTCILLLSADGKRLSYGAAPSVPASYCRATESIEIGPRAGSCAAAVYLGRPVYSVDIETDPVWGDYRDLALLHGFRSCWSTPIRNAEDAIIGTFAILHRTVGMPTHEELEAIELITGHVADAIVWFCDPHYAMERETRQSGLPVLSLVCDNQEGHGPATRLLALARQFELKAVDLDCYAAQCEAEATAEDLRNTAKLSRKLVDDIMAQIEHVRWLESR